MSWVDGSDGPYKSWVPGKPTRTAESCVFAFKDERFQWEETQCGNDYRAVCESKLPPYHAYGSCKRPLKPFESARLAPRHCLRD